MGGTAPGRVREGGTPPAQLGCMGERCKLPHRGLVEAPEANAFCFQRLRKLRTLKKKQGPLKIKVVSRLYCLIVYNVGRVKLPKASPA